MEKIDLHIHTRFSDGKYDLVELINLIKQAKLKKIAITDHDTIKKLDFTKELFLLHGIEMIPGIEINTSHKNMHILGYGITNFDYMESAINNIKLSNLESCIKVISLLNQEGIDIDVEKVSNMLYDDNQNIYNHYLKAMKLFNIESDSLLEEKLVETIIDKRAIVKYLLSKGYVQSVLEAYDVYMGYGKSCFMPINKFSEYDAINLIKNSGGIAVLAHPLTLKYNDIKMENTIKELKLSGLSGIEIYGTKMEESKILFFEHMTDKYDLLKTAGSDFHTQNETLGVECNEQVWKKLVKKINNNY